MNNVTLIGRLTKAPELEYSKNSNTAICTFTLAVNKRRKEDGANFIRVKTFNKQAENCDRYLDKGRQVAVSGELDCGSYKNNNGEWVNYCNVLANNVEFLGGSNEAATERSADEIEAAMPDEWKAGDTFAQVDDDIPF